MFQLAQLTPIVASSSPDAAVMSLIMVVLGFFGLFMLIGIAVKAFICYHLSQCLQRIPPEYRRQEPGMVWLLLIPFFSLVWNFFVWPKVAESFKAYFNAQGRTDVGDCGGGLALALSICGACSLVAGALAGIAALVMMIILLVQFNGYKNQISMVADKAFPTVPPARP